MTEMDGFIEIRDTHGKLLCKYNPVAGLVEIQHRGEKTSIPVVNMTAQASCIVRTWEEIADALMQRITPLVDVLRVFYEQLWRCYAEAGFPHGKTDAGLMNWLRSNRNDSDPDVDG